MTDTIRALLEIVMRALGLRAVPPLHLQLLRQRDGPRYPESKPAPERVTGPYSTSQQHSRKKGFQQ